MSFLAMTAAPVEGFEDNKIGTKQVMDNLKTLNKQNRTKRRQAGTKIHKEDSKFPKKNAFTAHNNEESDEDEESNLEKFTPLSTPVSVGVERRKEREVIDDEDRHEIQNQPVSPYVSLSNQQSEKPSNINDTPMGSDINLDDYRKNIASYYQPHQSPNQPNQPMGQKTDLTEKLNYLIHLLEEQQDERTQNVTEEVILYSFLGIFIIFVVDSFARVGKYVR